MPRATMDPDLARLIDAWAELPAKAKRLIAAILEDE
jgi:hypothetical protein